MNGHSIIEIIIFVVILMIEPTIARIEVDMRHATARQTCPINEQSIQTER